MGKHTIITEVSSYLVEVLKEELVPTFIKSKDLIGLCSPEAKGDYQVGVYLYDIQRSESMFTSEMRNTNLYMQKRPSEYLDLYYMITVYSESDLKFRSSEEQRILGKMLQVFMDRGVFRESDIGGYTRDDSDTMQIQMVKMPMSDKQKIFESADGGYRLSLFYKVSPVELESGVEKKISRVMDVDIKTEEL